MFNDIICFDQNNQQLFSSHNPASFIKQTKKKHVNRKHVANIFKTVVGCAWRD